MTARITEKWNYKQLQRNLASDKKDEINISIRSQTIVFLIYLKLKYIDRLDYVPAVGFAFARFPLCHLMLSI